MKRAIIGMLVVFALSACGGGNPQPNATPAPANTGTPAANNAPKANTEKDPPKEDPDTFKKVRGTIPAGWHVLKTPVKKEFERHTKGVPADWKFVSGIVNSEAPGPTEPEATWGAWEKQAAGAMLYFLPGEKLAARAAVEKYAETLSAGVPEVKEANEVAFTWMQGGEIMVFGMSNKYGTYVGVGVVLTTEGAPAREAIAKWAESIKPE